MEAALAFIAFLGWLALGVTSYQFQKLEDEYSASEKAWAKSWEMRESEFQAMFANANTDPAYDPFAVDMNSPLGYFAHLTDGSLANLDLFGGHSYEGDPTSGNPGEGEAWTLPKGQNISIG